MLKEVEVFISGVVPEEYDYGEKVLWKLVIDPIDEVATLQRSYYMDGKLVSESAIDMTESEGRHFFAQIISPVTSDGEVIIRRLAEATITVNGKPVTFHGRSISHREICELANPGKPYNENLDVMYTRGVLSKPRGSLTKGESVMLANGMEFTCVLIR